MVNGYLRIAPRSLCHGHGVSVSIGEVPQKKVRWIRVIGGGDADTFTVKDTIVIFILYRIKQVESILTALHG
jgi:hypothetical protein